MEQDNYLARLKVLAESYQHLDYFSKDRLRPSASDDSTKLWLSGEHFAGTPPDLCENVMRKFNASGVRSTCVVENITPCVMKAMGQQWHLDPHFFISFMNAGGHCTDARSFEHNDGSNESSDYITIRGQFVCNCQATNANWIHRERATTIPLGTFGADCISTCVSWYRLPQLDLFLVDELPNVHVKNRRPQVWFQAFDTTKHRALQLPLGLGPTDVFDTLRSSVVRFAESEVEKEVRTALQAHSFKNERKVDWLLCSWIMHSWQHCFSILDYRIQHISFSELRIPNKVASDRLHDLREDLARLKRAISHGAKVDRGQEPSPQLQDDFSAISNALQTYGRMAFKSATTNPQSPYTAYNQLLADISRQEDILVQSFQLLLGTIGVLESQASTEEARRSIEQSRRGALITWLAFIYAPLSFVTGVFGMNLKELNGSVAPFWVPIIAVPVVIIGTLSLYGAYKVWEDWRGISWSNLFDFERPKTRPQNPAKEPYKLV